MQRPGCEAAVAFRRVSAAADDIAGNGVDLSSSGFGAVKAAWPCKG